MPKFELHSDFKPMGDQPQAIEKLIAGLQRGDQHQVLLGATGTGKSLGYDEPLFIVEKHALNPTPRIVAIGSWIDALMQAGASDLHHEGETTILDLPNDERQSYAQAFDPDSGEVALYPIRAVIRHMAPQEMYRLQTVCGRGATMTGDHNVWVLRNGQLQLIKTSEAQPTDYIPVPETVLAGGQLATLDTLTLLKGKRLFVEAPEALLNYAGAHGFAPIAQTLTASGLKTPYSKLISIKSGKRGRGIAVNTFLHLLEQTNHLDGRWVSAKASVGGKLLHNRLPAELRLTPEVLQLMGYYLAEGNHQRGYVVIANRDEIIRRQIEAALTQLHIPFSVRATTDYQISSTALAELLQQSCGPTARTKHLPNWWPQLSAQDLGCLLQAYFDGNGTVGKASDISATTASPQLASDLAYALLALGIWARIVRKWKQATNSNHPGDWYYQVTISGQTNLRRYQQAIGFSVRHKHHKLASQLRSVENSNVDVVPISGRHLRALRIQLGLTAQALGQKCQLSRTAIQFIETNKRTPQRSNLVKILSALETIAHQTGLDSDEWWNAWRALSKLCQVHWTRLAGVSRIEYSGSHVYDLCVPGPETFLAGTGGFFVHNTFTIASIIEQTQRPTLVMAHNKTLAAQLYAEFKEFFPNNAVDYFVSYYDYYQPEAYVAKHDLYIEKETDINEEIDRLRKATTADLLTRRDVLIVASVSCIYGIGSPEAYGQAMIKLSAGQSIRRNALLRQLVEIYYERNDVELKLGTFRVRGDTLEIMLPHTEVAFRIAFFGDEVERITEYVPLTGEILAERQSIDLFPAKHFVTNTEKVKQAIADIEAELEERVKYFKDNQLLLEAQRIEQRAKYDLEMLREVGYCSGIENYSRHLDRRPAGSAPWTLVDYFPPDYLLVLDESHMTVPQIGGMWGGDRSRKEELIKYGFRLPSALDNRPLNFKEFEERMGQVIYTSATPGPYEMERATQVVQQIIRPTGLVDPEVEVRPVKGQIDDLVKEIRVRVARGERVLVTTLTKRMAEDLADYLLELGIKVHYLHSEVQTIERIEILRDLRLGVYDVVVGINLLREGLDLPEVSLVAILDADKEGFLRSGTSLIQTIGRAARHINGRVVMYADKLTDSMKRALDETNRRRKIQIEYNEVHHIVPAGIVKAVRDLTLQLRAVAEEKAEYRVNTPAQLPKDELARLIRELEKQMKDAAQQLEFEKAALIRDQIMDLRQSLREQEGVL